MDGGQIEIDALNKGTKIDGGIENYEVGNSSSSSNPLMILMLDG
jgi:hypothetical protein